MDGTVSLEAESKYENQSAEISDIVPVPKIVLEIVTTFNFLIFGAVIGLVGIIGNIVNIFVFLKQGFKDRINIALVAIAVSDIGSLMTLQMSNIMLNSWFMQLDIPIVQMNFVATVVVYPHNYFVRVCGFITAFASVERCLCVFAPFKVRLIITRKVSLFIVVCVYVILIFDLVPVYYMTYLDWRFFPETNSSKLGVHFRGNPRDVFGFIYFITDIFLPHTSFTIIVISNIILTAKMRKRTGNKVKLTNASQKMMEKMIKKDMNIIKMLLVVSALFIVCLIPQSALNTAIGFYREFGYQLKYQDRLILCYSVSYLTETVGSSVNIVVYYRMSTKFRSMFNAIFLKML
ncbi:FMRFamide receptor-like [Physella acuta]|uniref:FMRFamide receptor-like n=1 Tax=Physella acuta TaxID=109671 RepID=UPI0027DCC599|nr:FMRFamide receptor-like [Physella acuta]